MNIYQLALRLNERAKSEGHAIAQLPALRKKFLAKKQLPDTIFTMQSIFQQDKYAFHHGGRREMQFNVGEEKIDGVTITRYALSLSLEPSQSLSNPELQLLPYWRSFKKLAKFKPEIVAKFKLWYFTGIGKYRQRIIINPKQLDDSPFEYDNFFCIGGYIEKPISALNEDDISTILNGLNNLLPIYSYCVLNRKDIFERELRLVRVCWNENEWKFPSGPNGKSEYRGSHEKKYGYGHEEWSFDFTKIINGYHYCGLQAVENGRESFVGKQFDIKLYTHNSITDEFFWVGEINNFEVISEELANQAYDTYIQKGWLNEMADEVERVDGNRMKFESLQGKWQFNARFKPGDAEQYVPLRPLHNFFDIINTYHYQFIKTENKSRQQIEGNTINGRAFKFVAGKELKSTNTRTSNRERKTVEIIPVHDEIQNKLYRVLVEKYGAPNVGYETNTGMRTKIDLVVKVAKNEFMLYEVKSYPSVMISLRSAIGQLLEYAYWPEAIQNVNRLVVVSHIAADMSVIEYLGFLRKAGLNIYYQHYNLETNTLNTEQ